MNIHIHPILAYFLFQSIINCPEAAVNHNNKPDLDTVYIIPAYVRHMLAKSHGIPFYNMCPIQHSHFGKYVNHMEA